MSSSLRFKFTLEVLGSGQTYTVAHGLIIGRSRGSILFKNDLDMSSVHAQFEVEVDKVYLTDLNTSNGVFMNEQRLPPETLTLLKHRDHVRMGAQNFIFLAIPLEASATVVEVLPDWKNNEDDNEKTHFAPPLKGPKKLQ